MRNTRHHETEQKRHFPQTLRHRAGRCRDCWGRIPLSILSLMASSCSSRLELHTRLSGSFLQISRGALPPVLSRARFRVAVAADTSGGRANTYGGNVAPQRILSKASDPLRQPLSGNPGNLLSPVPTRENVGKIQGNSYFQRRLKELQAEA